AVFGTGESDACSRRAVGTDAAAKQRPTAGPRPAVFHPLRQPLAADVLLGRVETLRFPGRTQRVWRRPGRVGNAGWRAGSNDSRRSAPRRSDLSRWTI